MDVKVGISARHIHLCQQDINVLFGQNYMLTKERDLSQPGDYACNDKVILKNQFYEIKDVRVLGPIREYTQVEMSKTDSYYFHLTPPVRTSGDLEGASSINIIGPNGSIERDCVIIATRHIHMTLEDAGKYNLVNRQLVSVQLVGVKGGRLDNVYVKVKDQAALELHLDLDDANAHLIEKGDVAHMVEVNIHE